MASNIRSVIIGTGKCIPNQLITNNEFLNHQFHEKTGERIERENTEIIEKFKDITEIEERRYAENNQVTSDLGFIAAENALLDSGIDKETLDYIVVAHNFGDIVHGTSNIDMVPTIAARIKGLLKIENPDCVAYDLPFGCPGWLQAIIQADYFIRSGDAKRVLVVGAETLSRVTDPHDRDSMIYADGAGATILQAVTGTEKGIICHKTQSHTLNEVGYLFSGKSSNAGYTGNELFIKMEGRKIYEYAITHVPAAIKATLEKGGISIGEVKKVLIHQANGKMDEAILKRLFKLYGVAEIPAGIMPMTIAKLGNSSVATIPTLLDMMLKKEMPGQEINEGDIVVLASVGAGMNINAAVYRF